MSALFAIVLLSFTWSQYGFCYNILVTHLGISTSQTITMYRLADILGERGHNVTVLYYKLTEEVAKPSLKYSKEVIFDARSDFWKERVDLKTEEFLQDVAWNSTNTNLDCFSKLYRFLCIGAIAHVFFVQNKTAVDEFIEMDQFDLAIIYQFDTSSFGLSRALGIKKVIWVSTSYFLDPMPWASGVPTPASHVPSGSHPVTDHMSFLERVWNLLLRIFFEFGHYYLNIRYYNMVNRYYYSPDFPDLNDLLSNVDLYVLNSNMFFEYPRPVAYNVVDMSGLTYADEPSNNIRQRWKNIMQQHSNPQAGTIIFSLGSVIDSSFMPSSLKSNFLDSFKAFGNHTFISRLAAVHGKNVTQSNIIFEHWIPQRYLLSHFKVDALITHAGYNSISEAAYFGVPTILIPFCGDQFGNVKRQEKLQTGISLTKESLSKEAILSALDRILIDDRIARRANKLGKMIRDRIITSKERLVHSIESLLRRKKLRHMKIKSGTINFVTLYFMDVLFTILMATSTLVFLIFSICCCISRASSY